MAPAQRSPIIAEDAASLLLCSMRSAPSPLKIEISFDAAFLSIALRGGTNRSFREMAGSALLAVLVSHPEFFASRGTDGATTRETLILLEARFWFSLGRRTYST